MKHFQSKKTDVINAGRFISMSHVERLGLFLAGMALLAQGFSMCLEVIATEFEWIWLGKLIAFAELLTGIMLILFSTSVLYFLTLANRIRKRREYR